MCLIWPNEWMACGRENKNGKKKSFLFCFGSVSFTKFNSGVMPCNWFIYYVSCAACKFPFSPSGKPKPLNHSEFEKKKRTKKKEKKMESGANQLISLCSNSFIYSEQILRKAREKKTLRALVSFNFRSIILESIWINFSIPAHMKPIF